MADFTREREAYLQGVLAPAGVDEVGRGCLFGPVVAAAVVLDPLRIPDGLKDSKKLTPRKRGVLSQHIFATARGVSVGWATAAEIDEHNILGATRLAMRRALRHLSPRPDYVLVDAIDPQTLGFPGEGIIGGDGLCLSIAAASIVAKVFRDDLMVRFSHLYPAYGLDKNKGYPTSFHASMLSLNGLTPFHRSTFRTGSWPSR